MFQVNQLIGFGVEAASAGSATISLFGSATSTSSTITMPASILAGDLIVILDRAENNQAGPTDPVSVTPTGFTSVSTLLSSLWYLRQHVSFKKAAGTEGGTSITGMNGNFRNDKAAYVFRLTPAAATLTASSPNAEETELNPLSQNVAASGGVAPLVVFGCYGAFTAVSPRTFSTTKDGEVNPSTQLYLAYKIYNSAPANTSIDMDDEGDANMLQSFYIQMA